MFKDQGRRLRIEAGDCFPHMIVYAPEGAPFVCVENLTTCPNGPNLLTAGKGDLANVLVGKPGDFVDVEIDASYGSELAGTVVG